MTKKTSSFGENLAENHKKLSDAHLRALRIELIEQMQQQFKTVQIINALHSPQSKQALQNAPFDIQADHERNKSCLPIEFLREYLEVVTNDVKRIQKEILSSTQNKNAEA